MLNNIDPYKIDESVFRLLDKDWMLITAGVAGHFNTMTASWGGFGILWHQPFAFIFVRPNRYTFQFLEQFSIFEIQPNISQRATELISQYNLSHNLLIPDALIAATAMEEKIPLASKNQRDFKFIKGLTLLAFPVA